MAYSSPLAGGFLTGNFSLGNDLGGTRFAEGNVMGAHYRPMYDKPELHAAVRKMHAVLEPQGISLTEAALRWIYHHSALSQQDAIILGATKTSQIEANVAQIGKGPLPQGVVEIFISMWKEVEGYAP